MKHFRIIFSTLLLFFAASACMLKQEKEVFESAEVAARTSNVNKAIVKDDLFSVNGGSNVSYLCYAPTNLSVTQGATQGVFTFSWLAPVLSNPSSYTVTLTYYPPSGPPMPNSITVYVPTVTASLITTGGYYELSIVSNCGGGNSSSPLIATYTPNIGGHGGNVDIIADNLDLFTSPSGSFGGASYIYSVDFIPGSATNYFNQSCVKSIIGTSVYSVSNFSSSPNGTLTPYYLFTTPNPSQTTSCTDANGNNLIDISIRIPGGIREGTWIGYKPTSPANASWRAVQVIISHYGFNPLPYDLSTTVIPGLKRLTQYKFKFLSSYGASSSSVAPSPCSAGS